MLKGKYTFLPLNPYNEAIYCVKKIVHTFSLYPEQRTYDILEFRGGSDWGEIGFTWYDPIFSYYNKEVDFSKNFAYYTSELSFIHQF